MHTETVIVLVISVLFFGFPIWVPAVQRLLKRDRHADQPTSPEVGPPSAG